MNQNDFPSELLGQLPVQQTLNFEYNILETKTRILVQQCTNEIKTLMRRNSQDIIDIGQKLIEVKQHLGHGTFRKWVECEFNWSVSATAKFMQVAEQFKCVNFTHLNITASALYLIAAPSTPQEVREEVLERASNGENIGYTKAKVIVCQHRKTKKGAVEPKAASLDSNEPVNVIEPTSAFSAQKDLTEKEAQTATRSLSSHEPLPSFAFKNEQIATTIKDMSDDTIQIPTRMENLVAVSHETSDAAITETVISIKNLTSEQLARAIILAVNTGLSKYQLEAIIMASQQALKKVFEKSKKL